MKFIILLLLFADCLSCFGQTDTNLIASGDWSPAVRDTDGYALRGRLLVYDERTAPYHARIYLELQHVFRGSGRWDDPIEINYDNARGNVLHFSMRDGFDKPVPMYPTDIRCLSPSPYWITLPCDSTVRLRADWYDCGPSSQPDGLEILVADGDWLIRPDATNDFFLSATFTPPDDHLSCLKYHVWQASLKLAKVKIPVKEP